MGEARSAVNVIPHPQCYPAKYDGPWDQNSVEFWCGNELVVNVPKVELRNTGMLQIVSTGVIIVAKFGGAVRRGEGYLRSWLRVIR